MGWQTETIDTFSIFVDEIRALSPHWPNPQQWLFRGQANSEWTLEPSLVRIFKDQGLVGEKLVAIERDMRRAFKGEAHRFLPSHYLSEYEGDVTHWWAVMRHFGAPTRILDWTLSPYVGLYFAVEGRWNEPGALWCVRGKAIGKKFGAPDPAAYKKTWRDDRKKTKGNPFTQGVTKPLLYVYDMQHQIDRIAAQQGRFTVCTDGVMDHSDLLEHHLSNADLYKFVIPARRKAEFLRELHLMNITAKALFPGIDGLGRSIEEIARLSIKFDRPLPPTEGSIEK